MLQIHCCIIKMAQQAGEDIMTVNAFAINDRIVVVIGKTGAGKSTVANKILESSNVENRFIVSDTVLESVTRSVSSEKALLKTKGDVYYSVEVVDTIGLFDTSTLSKKRNNNDIMKEIETFFKERISGANLILFVFKQGRWTDEEKQTFDLFTKYFVDTAVSNISALIVTGCDGYTEEQKEKVCKEFKENQPDISNFMKKGVLAVSFQDVSKLIEEIRPIHKEKQKADQEKLRQLVYECKDMKLTKDIVQDNFWEKVKTSLCTIL